jgi:EAL domain-containing protein (putative c-di-GMP-specific phosphodiesterase class I)/GGDEF domain-containing protein
VSLFGALSIYNDVKATQQLAKVQLHSHAQDAANQLGLSISPYLNTTDMMIAQTMAKAMFDSGFYQKLEYFSADGVKIFSFNNDHGIQGVPGWFVKKVTISPPTVRQPITSGWQQAGELSVQSHSGIFYQTLYANVKSTILLHVSLLSTTLLIGWFCAYRLSQFYSAVLHYIKHELDDGSSVFQYTSRFKELGDFTLTLNDVFKCFKQKSTKGHKLEHEIAQDQLTTLYSRYTFEHDYLTLQKKQRSQPSQHSEILFGMILVRLNGLSKINVQHGRQAGDVLIKTLANEIYKVSTEVKGLRAYRVTGCEFVLMGEITHNGLNTLCEKLESRLIINVPLSEGLLSISPLTMQANEDLSSVFLRSDLYSAKQHFYHSKPTLDLTVQAGLSKSQWADLLTLYTQNAVFLNTALKLTNEQLVCLISSYDEHFSLFLQPIKNSEQQTLFYEVCIGFNYEGRQISTEDVFIMAENLGFAYSLEKTVVYYILCCLKLNPIDNIAINISNSVMRNYDFTDWLFNELGKVKHFIPNLKFELNEHALCQYERVSQHFITRAKKLNIDIIVDRFGSSFTSFQLIKRLNVDFIKFDGRYIKQCQSADNRFFVLAVTQLCQGIGIVVVASHVEDNNIAQLCLDMNVNALQGNGVEPACALKEFSEKKELLQEYAL